MFCYFPTESIEEKKRFDKIAWCRYHKAYFIWSKQKFGPRTYRNIEILVKVFSEYMVQVLKKKKSEVSHIKLKWCKGKLLNVVDFPWLAYCIFIFMSAWVKKWKQQKKEKFKMSCLKIVS